MSLAKEARILLEAKKPTNWQWRTDLLSRELAGMGRILGSESLNSWEPGASGWK